jgi:hypothetical protein
MKNIFLRHPKKVTGVFDTDPDLHPNALVRAQRYGSEDPDLHSNPYQNVTDPDTRSEEPHLLNMER